MEGKKPGKGKGPGKFKGKGAVTKKFPKKAKGKKFPAQDGKKKFTKNKPKPGKDSPKPAQKDTKSSAKNKITTKEKGFKRKFTPEKDEVAAKKKKTGKETSPEEEHKEGSDAKVKLHEMKKKDRKEFRRKHNQKENYDLLVWMKKAYETLRRKNVQATERQSLIDEVLEKISGHSHDVAFKHDTGRVIQSCIKFGTAEQRTKLFNQFKDDLVDLVKSKYSKFFVKKLLKYGTKEERTAIVKCFYGKVRRLIAQKEAGDVLETVYSDYANAAQRSALLQEFYGPEFALFKDTEPKTLSQIIEESPSKKEGIIKHMKEALTPLSTKTGMNHTIVHRAMSEYFSYAEGQQRAEMIEAVRESVVYILHTHDGARVAMHCVWHGTPKDRKILVKSFKQVVNKICKEEFGHLVMLAVFDTVDDTVLVKKALLPDLIENLAELMNDQYGRKVISYLLTHRQPPFCHPKISEVLQMGDKNAHSKKDPAIRRKELLGELSPHLLKLVQENAEELLQDKPRSVLLPLIIAKCSGNISPAMHAVIDVVVKEMDPTSEEEDHILKSASGHAVIKKLIQQDKERIQNNNEENVELFAPLLLEKVNSTSLFHWCQFNRGAFVVASLLESSVDEVAETANNMIQPFKKDLKKFPSKGLEIVLKHLS